MKDNVQDRASDLTACYHESLRKSWPGVAASLQCSLLQVPNNRRQSLPLLPGAHCYSVTKDKGQERLFKATVQFVKSNMADNWWPNPE